MLYPKTIMTINPDDLSIPKAFTPTSGLYLVATPIGNLRDMSLRALDVLKAANIVACEDTRVTGKLLKAYNIKAPKLIRCDAHQEDHQADMVISAIKDNQIVALCCDAGAPLISDPGAALVQKLRAADCPVTSIPGPSSVINALQLSGLPSTQFSFIGFVPQKGRDNFFASYKDTPTTLICFERHSRLQKTIDSIRSVLGDRDVVLARELTKLYEEIIPIDNIAPDVKGECVLVIAPPAPVKKPSRNELYAMKLAAKNNDKSQ